MKETYSIIRNYFLNGVFAYALFGIYAIAISPFISQFIDYGGKNSYISIFGFVMMSAEFFALNFKLKMVKLRSEERRILYKIETGIDTIPSASQFVLFGFFVRLIFRIPIIMISMTALGYQCSEKVMSPIGLTVLMLWLLADMLGCMYIYFKTGFYTDPPENKRELKELLKEEEDWDRANFKLASSEKYCKMEIISDIILQIYALMLFTTFWKYINQTGIAMLHSAVLNKDSSSEILVDLFLMLFCISMLGLIPIRIAYWIEDSMQAFSTKEKFGIWIMFFIVAIFTCAPVIIKFITLFILHSTDIPLQSEHWYSGYLITMTLFFLLLLVQILMFGKKIQKTTRITNDTTLQDK